MITSEIISVMDDTIKNDETMCRLLAYGLDPFGDDKEDIIGSANHDELMNDIINLSPQIPNIEKFERPRICLYKGFAKMAYLGASTIQETIQIDIFVPFALLGRDYRVYQIENKLISLFDRMSVGIGHLDYSDGQFIQSPSISGYAQYKMLFVIQEGRPNIGKY